MYLHLNTYTFESRCVFNYVEIIESAKQFYLFFCLNCFSRRSILKDVILT